MRGANFTQKGCEELNFRREGPSGDPSGRRGLRAVLAAAIDQHQRVHQSRHVSIDARDQSSCLLTHSPVSERVEPLLQSDLRPRTSPSQWEFRSWGLRRYWAEAWWSHFTLLTPVRVEEGWPGNIATATRRMRVSTNPDQPGPALVDPKHCWVTSNTAFSNASTQDFQYLACAIPSVGHRWHCSKRFPAVLNGPWGSASVFDLRKAAYALALRRRCYRCSCNLTAPTCRE
jgi:hypothetical protein